MVLLALLPIGITLTDDQRARAIVKVEWINVAGGGSFDVYSRNRVSITSNTHIRFVRAGGSTSYFGTLRWTLIVFKDAKKVISGTHSLSAVGNNVMREHNVAVSVSDFTKCIVFVTSYHADLNSITGCHVMSTHGFLSSNTNLKLFGWDRLSGVITSFHYFIVEFP